MFVEEKPQGETATTIEPWRKALLDAADLIEKYGLAKECRRDAMGSMCVHGALAVALGYNPIIGAPELRDQTGGQALLALYERVNGAPPGGGSVRGMAPWNNAPQRTQAEVVATLREAARKP